MEKFCRTCKFRFSDSTAGPCVTCDQLGYDGKNNWQPARPKRKELEARVAELAARLADREAKLADLRGHEAQFAELKVQLADWKRWHQFREEELKVANAELESMHRELADKQAIIDEQKKEIAQLRMWMRLYEWGGGF